MPELIESTSPAVLTPVVHENRKLYSVLEIKQVDDDLRVLRGIATTPAPDRAGDIVEPLGVSFKNPLPLLWQHNSREPVGQAKLGKPTKDGISFEARIPKVSEPGRLKDRLDEVWQSLKAGLVRGVSIGFKANELSFLKDGGIHFLETEVLELSLVTIPANSAATIDELKAFDVGQKTMLAVNGGATQPGAIKQLAKAKTMTKSMTIAEQISAFEGKRASSAARMESLMNKAADEAQTLDDEESKEYDDLGIEVKRVDEHLKRLHDLETMNKNAARPVNGDTPQNGSASRDIALLSTTRPNPIISVKANVPQGIPFVRYAMAMMAGKGMRTEALAIAREQRAWHNTPEVELALTSDVQSIIKAAQGAGTTTDASFASPLIAYQVMGSEFIEYLRPMTIIGRIPGLRRVPFNIQMPRQTAGSSTGWVGEAAPKPVSGLTFDTVTLRWAKAAAIVVLTEELVRFSNPSAEMLVRQDMVEASAEFLDRQFVDPTVAAVTNVSPASITNGVTSVIASGTTASAFRADVKSLFANFITANLPTNGGVWIMHSSNALSLSLMLNSLGQQVFPALNPEGGTLVGYPVIVSQNIPATGSSPTDGYPMIFAIAPEIMLADEGQVVIDASREASLQMDTAPDSPPSASTNMVSLWQMNQLALRAERFINWQKRRSTAVQYVQNAKYTE